MAAIPIIIFDNGAVNKVTGSLFEPPVELFSKVQMAFYASCKTGWTVCPLGYSVFSEFDGLGRKVVIPGIHPPQGPHPKRKFPNYPLRFSKDQITNFASSHLEVADQIRDQRDTEFKNLTHDLRGISTEIYHTALSLKSEIDADRTKYASDKVNAVLDAQQMMSLRLDIVDYESGLSSSRPTETIAPFRKIDKVIKSFRNRSFKSGISIRTDGWLKYKIHGPPIFEIVPFVIIENAFKYAPKGSEILIRFEENFEQENIIIRFESFGPKIRVSEYKKIFERNFRGSSVQKEFKAGSGIGLFAARTIIETHFSGSIHVNQLDDAFEADGEVFYRTRFTIILPGIEPNNERLANRHRPKLGMETTSV
jgi:signal transduction histidine kinase